MQQDKIKIIVNNEECYFVLHQNNNENDIILSSEDTDIIFIFDDIVKIAIPTDEVYIVTDFTPEFDNVDMFLDFLRTKQLNLNLYTYNSDDILEDIFKDIFKLKMEEFKYIDEIPVPIDNEFNSKEDIIETLNLFNHFSDISEVEKSYFCEDLKEYLITEFNPSNYPTKVKNIFYENIDWFVEEIFVKVVDRLL